MFHSFAFSCLCCCCLVGVFAGTDELKSVSVMEGDSVSLNSGLTEIQNGDDIIWRFGPNRSLIAITDGVNNMIYDVPNGRFRDRLKLDNKTGSLTIMNITTDHTGVYEVKISGISSSSTYRFTVTVYAPLPVPVISNSSHCSSSSSCSLVCSSVVNVSHATLSWYAGMSVLSSISASDLSISLSLPLEVEYQDKNTYSCVLNNPISSQTTHLDITQFCHSCAAATTPDPVTSGDVSTSASSSSPKYSPEGHAPCCDSVEAALRLVVTALMGVASAAAAVLLVNDVRAARG
ncbi:SLAM family member 6-like [Pimephales promelas]|nr:SLAM family member 6-like [Pimephales promelas]